MPSADVRDLRVYYELEGEGPRLLLISGSGDDERRKPNIFSTRFGSEFEILAYNQRGHAPTTIPDGPYTMRDYAEDTNALLEAVGWDSCLVMGISFGGTVGQEFALRFPQRIERLLLNCTSSGGQGRSSYPLIDLLDLDPTERFHTLIRLTNYGDAFLAANAALIQESLDQYLVAADDPLATLGQRLLLEARAEHDVYDRLPGLTMPVHGLRRPGRRNRSPRECAGDRRADPQRATRILRGRPRVLRDGPQRRPTHDPVLQRRARLGACP